MNQYIFTFYTALTDGGFSTLPSLVARETRLVVTSGFHSFRKFWHQMRCPEAVARPYDLRYVSPGEINYVATKRLMSSQALPTDQTHIVGGDWDRPDPDAELNYVGELPQDQFDDFGTTPVDNYRFYRSVKNHVRHDRAWTDTEFYRWLMTTDNLPTDWEYTTEEGRQWRFNELDRLARSMQEDGYLSQRECEKKSEITSGHKQFDVCPEYPEDVPPECKEVAISIGRDGKLIFEEGRHRFSVARALELNRIPVRVFARHTRWQARREEIAKAKSPAEVSPETRQYLSHPDMVDVATFPTQQSAQSNCRKLRQNRYGFS